MQLDYKLSRISMQWALPSDFCQLINSETKVVLSILKNLQLVYNTHCNNIIDLELGITVEQCSSKFTTSVEGQIYQYYVNYLGTKWPL